MGKPLQETSKEIGRVVALAVISYLLTDQVIDRLVSWVFGSSLDVYAQGQITALLTVILRSLDKYLYELGKEIGNNTLMKGLTRF